MLNGWLNYAAATRLAAGNLFAQTPARVQTFPLRDAAGLIAPKVKTEAVKYLGRRCVRITMDGEDHEGLAANREHAPPSRQSIPHPKQMLLDRVIGHSPGPTMN
jgi:hypothetical protein